jgi:DNA-binding MarR family transcriptional regulator
LRAQCITREKLDDAAWDMLLDLASAERRGQRLSVSGLMVSSSHVSATTLLRRVNALVDREFVARKPDPQDARRHFVDMTSKGHALVSEFLAQVGDKLYPRAAQSGHPSGAYPRLSARSVAAGSS